MRGSADQPGGQRSEGQQRERKSDWLQFAAALATVSSAVVGGFFVSLGVWAKLDSLGKAAVCSGLCLMVYGAWRFGTVWPPRRRMHAGISDGDQPDRSLSDLAKRALQTTDPFCRTHKAIEQGGIAVGLVLTRHLVWWVSEVTRHLRYYLQEWGREKHIGRQSVTKMFYEFSRRACIEMMELKRGGQVQYEHLLSVHPELSAFREETETLVAEFRSFVEQPLLQAEGLDDAGEVQRKAAEKVEQLIERSNDLHRRIEEWQVNAKAQADSLRERLLTTG